VRLPILAVMAIALLSASAAQASALHRLEAQFTSMNDKEVVVKNKSGKRYRLKRDLLKKSDFEMLTKKSNGKFVKFTVISRAIINEKGKQ
jgi:hypothetical protein